MKNLALFYTNNKVKPELLKLVLDNISKAVAVSNSYELKVSAYEPIEGYDVVIAPHPNTGHYSIVTQLLSILNTSDHDLVTLLEHDCLYPLSYLSDMEEVFREFTDIFEYTNLIGVNKTGYVPLLQKDVPMSTLTFKRDVLIDHLNTKLKECLRDGFCYLEPGYGGSTGSNLTRSRVSHHNAPIVHVNMDKTANNHHFTSHYSLYDQQSTVGFTGVWPVDISYLFD